MADIVNLRRARKDKARREHEARAAANRRRFGRTKVEKEADKGAQTRAEREIDELALDLLAMQQPMAVDLRFIMACMKINADLERVRGAGLPLVFSYVPALLWAGFAIVGVQLIPLPLT